MQCRGRSPFRAFGRRDQTRSTLAPLRCVKRCQDLLQSPFPDTRARRIEGHPPALSFAALWPIRTQGGDLHGIDSDRAVRPALVTHFEVMVDTDAPAIDPTDDTSLLKGLLGGRFVRCHSGHDPTFRQNPAPRFPGGDQQDLDPSPAAAVRQNCRLRYPYGFSVHALPLDHRCTSLQQLLAGASLRLTPWTPHGKSCVRRHIVAEHHPTSRFFGAGAYRRV